MDGSKLLLLVVFCLVLSPSSTPASPGDVGELRMAMVDALGNGDVDEAARHAVEIDRLQPGDQAIANLASRARTEATLQLEKSEAMEEFRATRDRIAALERDLEASMTAKDLDAIRTDLALLAELDPQNAVANRAKRSVLRLSEAERHAEELAQTNVPRKIVVLVGFQTVLELKIQGETLEFKGPRASIGNHLRFDVDVRRLKGGGNTLEYLARTKSPMVRNDSTGWRSFEFENLPDRGGCVLFKLDNELSGPTILSEVRYAADRECDFPEGALGVRLGKKGGSVVVE